MPASISVYGIEPRNDLGLTAGVRVAAINVPAVEAAAAQPIRAASVAYPYIPTRAWDARVGVSRFDRQAEKAVAEFLEYSAHRRLVSLVPFRGSIPGPGTDLHRDTGVPYPDRCTAASAGRRRAGPPVRAPYLHADVSQTRHIGLTTTRRSPRGPRTSIPPGSGVRRRLQRRPTRKCILQRHPMLQSHPRRVLQKACTFSCGSSR